MINFLNNLLIKSVYAGGPASSGQAGGNDVVGQIVVPPGVPSSVLQISDLISVMVRFIVIVAGIFALWQFLMGGFGLVTSGGDKGKVAESHAKINMSLIGLIVIAGSFLITAIISQILFGSFTAILDPQFQSL